MAHKTGVAIGLAVLIAVALVLYLNLQTKEPPSTVTSWSSTEPASTDQTPAAASDLAGIETFVGEAERNGMVITAVWLPPIEMESQQLPQHSNVIHLEADIHALRGNKNGFGMGAWIPYLTVIYEIEPIEPPGESIRGEMMPMVAKDGPHYGATIEMPGLGKYKLTYRIDNPSKKGFGRHNDPITGVDPWWDPFEVVFDFDYQSRLSTTN